jgi:hypothetical protein
LTTAALIWLRRIAASVAARRHEFFVATAKAVLPILGPTHGARADWIPETFIDPEDGAFDMSKWLGRGGFLPVPIIITEPAVDNGLGIAGAFVHGMDKKANSRPDVSGAFALKTGNASSAYGGFHLGHYLQDRLHYRGAVSKVDINLDLNRGGQFEIGYNVRGLYTAHNLRYRLGNSHFFAGVDWEYVESDFSFNLGNVSGRVPGLAPTTSSLSGLGPALYYDDLDNLFTPGSGIKSEFEVTKQDDAWGSDFDFRRVEFNLMGFRPVADKWVLGAYLRSQTIDGDAPFYVFPAIKLRGIPAQRYQGRTAGSLELEARYDVTPRWSVLGFAGAGKTDDEFTADNKVRLTGGAGFRYKLARQFGLYAGADLARGPEGWVGYLQVGHAW